MQIEPCIVMIIFMDRKRVIGTLLLLLASVIWGASFVAQSAGMEYVEPFTFICVRSFIAGIALLPLAFVLDRRGYRKDEPKNTGLLLIVGAVCGLLLFLATNLQQFGIVYIGAGKAGFITSLYIILVPIFSRVIGARIRPLVWVSALIASGGLYLISVRENFSIGMGDMLVLICAAFFAVHILVVSRFSARLDCVRLSSVQFLACGLFSLPFVLIYETPSFSAIVDCWLPILYSALLSAGVGYTLQIIGQKYVEPSRASLMMCLESVFAVLSGWLILGERLSARELAGCVFVFIAVVLAVLPERKKAEATELR